MDNRQQTIGDKTIDNTGEEHHYELISNASGVADEKQIKPEIYGLKFELPGYEVTELANERVKLGQKLQLDMELKPLS